MAVEETARVAKAAVALVAVPWAAAGWMAAVRAVEAWAEVARDVEVVALEAAATAVVAVACRPDKHAASARPRMGSARHGKDWAAWKGKTCRCPQRSA